MENKNYKFIWNENFVFYSIVTFLLIIAGQLVGSIVLNIPAGVYLGYNAAKTGQDMTEIAQNLVFPDFLETAFMYLMPIGSWIVVLLVLLIKKNKPIMKSFSKKVAGNTIPKFLLGLLIGFGLNAFCALIAVLTGKISLSFDAFNLLTFIFILLCVFIQSSSEEALCRGYLYQKLLHRYKNPAIAIIGNSVLFALMHIFNSGITVLAFLNIVLAGLLFSLMVYYMDSIWAAFAAHTAWNFTQNILFGLPNSGQVTPYSVFKLDEATALDGFAYDVAFGIEGTVLAVIVLILACLAIYLIGKKKNVVPTDIWAEYDAALEKTEEVTEENKQIL